MKSLAVPILATLLVVSVAVSGGRVRRVYGAATTPSQVCQGDILRTCDLREPIGLPPLIPETELDIRSDVSGVGAAGGGGGADPGSGYIAGTVVDAFAAAVGGAAAAVGGVVGAEVGGLVGAAAGGAVGGAVGVAVDVALHDLNQTDMGGGARHISDTLFDQS